MPVARMRCSLWRMLVGVAIAAGMAAYISSMEPTYIYAAPTSDMIILDVATPIGPDGRRCTYTESQWAAMIAQMSCNAVLDAALADHRIARLSLFRGVADPRSALSGMFQIIVASSIETDSRSAVRIVTLHAHSPTAVYDVADALGASIAANGPGGVTVRGRPITPPNAIAIGRVPWDRDWRLYAIVTASLVAIVVILVLPEPK